MAEEADRRRFQLQGMSAESDGMVGPRSSRNRDWVLADADAVAVHIMSYTRVVDAQYSWKPALRHELKRAHRLNPNDFDLEQIHRDGHRDGLGLSSPSDTKHGRK